MPDKATEAGFPGRLRKGDERVKMGTAKGKGGGREVLEPFFISEGYYLSLYFTIAWSTRGAHALACGMHTSIVSLGVSPFRGNGTR